MSMDLSKSYDYFQPEKDTARIHIIGCGSVGATVAENLARCGITKFTLWDFDVVEPKTKVEALLGILTEINPDIKDDVKLEPKGWQGKTLSGYIFLCVDNIDLRRKFVEQHMDSPYVKAMFDFRTRLEDAQHYAADWSNDDMKKDLLASMQFTHEEAKEETPVSACNVTLSVCPTVRIICAYGVANFMNFWNGKPIKKLILADAFKFDVMAF